MLSLFKPNVRVFLAMVSGDTLRKISRRTNIQTCNMLENFKDYERFKLVKINYLTRPREIEVTDKGRLVQGILKEIVEVII